MTKLIVFILSLLVLACVPINALAKGVSSKQVATINDIVWAADKVEVPRALLLALCWGEGWAYKSHGKNPTHMDGGSTSYGICQVKLATAQYMDTVYKHRAKATATRLEINKVNAFYAAKYLKYQLKRYDGDWKLAVDAYNKHNAKGQDTPYVRKFQLSLAYVSTFGRY